MTDDRSTRSQIEDPHIENLVQMLEYAAEVDASPSPALVADVRRYITDLEAKVERALDLLDEVAGVPCDHTELNGRRRYWCSTHQEYGTDDGCRGERARALLNNLEKSHG